MSDKALAHLDAQHAKDREAAEDAAQDTNELVNRNREAAAKAYANSDQGAARAEQIEADRVMRLPTPETLKEIGSVVPKDPTRFPSE